MKKIFLSCLFVLGVGIGSTFARNDHPEISKKVLESFKDRFAGALDVTWVQQRNLEKATFRIDGLICFAYFDTEGEWVATARNILSSELPIPLLLHLKKDYGGCWISELVEVDGQSGINYYIALEDASRSILLNSGGYDEWILFKKVKKD